MRSFVTLSRRTPRADPLAALRITPDQRRLAHLAASVLLTYPDAETRARARDVRGMLGQLPEPVAQRLGACCDALAAADPQPLEARYVAAFDLKRQCSMYLSYFAAGDTRRRGMALVRFVQAYRAAGWEIASDELPDYLPTVLEFSARATGDDAAIAIGLLGTHREGIEVLRSALGGLGARTGAAGGQPWTQVVEAICLTLGPLDAETEARYTELITAGPPTEMVGVDALGPLEPYAPTLGEPR